MKKFLSAELHGRIIHTRAILSAKNSNLYEVAFENGSSAVLRVTNTLPLKEGDMIGRVNDVWSSGQHIIHPSPFEFVEKSEAQRYFIEYER